MTRDLFVLILFSVALSFCPLLSEGVDHSGIYPKIIATHPKNGASDVDPSLSKITVT